MCGPGWPVNSPGLESTHFNAPYQKGINPEIIGPLSLARHTTLRCIMTAKIGPSWLFNTLASQRPLQPAAQRPDRLRSGRAAVWRAAAQDGRAAPAWVAWRRPG